MRTAGPGMNALLQRYINQGREKEYWLLLKQGIEAAAASVVDDNGKPKSRYASIIGKPEYFADDQPEFVTQELF